MENWTRRLVLLFIISASGFSSADLVGQEAKTTHDDGSVSENFVIEFNTLKDPPAEIVASEFPASLKGNTVSQLRQQYWRETGMIEYDDKILSGRIPITDDFRFRRGGKVFTPDPSKPDDAKLINEAKARVRSRKAESLKIVRAVRAEFRRRMTIVRKNSLGFPNQYFDSIGDRIDRAREAIDAYEAIYLDFDSARTSDAVIEMLEGWVKKRKAAEEAIGEVQKDFERKVRRVAIRGDFLHFLDKGEWESIYDTEGDDAFVVPKIEAERLFRRNFGNQIMMTTIDISTGRLKPRRYVFTQDQSRRLRELVDEVPFQGMAAEVRKTFLSSIKTILVFNGVWDREWPGEIHRQLMDQIEGADIQQMLTQIVEANRDNDTLQQDLNIDPEQLENLARGEWDESFRQKVIEMLSEMYAQNLTKGFFQMDLYEQVREAAFMKHHEESNGVFDYIAKKLSERLFLEDYTTLISQARRARDAGDEVSYALLMFTAFWNNVEDRFIAVQTEMFEVQREELDAILPELQELFTDAIALLSAQNGRLSPELVNVCQIAIEFKPLGEESNRSSLLNVTAGAQNGNFRPRNPLFLRFKELVSQRSRNLADEYGLRDD